MYLIGLILSKIISKSKIHSMVERLQVNNQGIGKEINAVIEKDVNLNREMTQLSNTKCDCENDKTMNWSFPVLCTLLFPLFMFSVVLFATHINLNMVFVIDNIGNKLNCFWSYMIP
jgi:hypothetical protein